MLNKHIKVATFCIIILLEVHSHLLCNIHRMLGIPSTNFYYPVVNSKSTTSDYNLTLTFSTIKM